MSKHTKGPWHFEHNRRTSVMDSSGRILADVKLSSFDAQLMAAAPELLEACEKARFALQGTAIKHEGFEHDWRLDVAEALEGIALAIAKAGVE